MRDMPYGNHILKWFLSGSLRSHPGEVSERVTEGRIVFFHSNNRLKSPFLSASIISASASKSLMAIHLLLGSPG